MGDLKRGASFHRSPRGKDMLRRWRAEDEYADASRMATLGTHSSLLKQRAKVAQYPARYGLEGSAHDRLVGLSKLLFAATGTVWPGVWMQVLLLVALSIGVFLFDTHVNSFNLHWQGHAFVLTPMAFLVVFSCSQSYSRYWEGRVLLSKLGYETTCAFALLANYCPPGHARDHLVYHSERLLLAYCVCVRHAVHSYWDNVKARMSGDKDHDAAHWLSAELDLYLTPEERDLILAVAVPEKRGGYQHGDYVLIPLTLLKRYVGHPRRSSLFSGPDGAALRRDFNAHLEELQGCYGGMMRICTTPLALAWAHLMRLTVWLWLLTVPVPLVTVLGADGASGWVAIPVHGLLSFLFLGLIFISEEMGNPFGEDVADLDFQGTHLAIHRNLRLLKRVSRDPEWSVADKENPPTGADRSARPHEPTAAGTPRNPALLDYSERCPDSPLDPPGSREPFANPLQGAAAASPRPGDEIDVMWEGLPTPAKVLAFTADGGCVVEWADGAVGKAVVDHSAPAASRVVSKAVREKGSAMQRWDS
eukprot:TRINITY_DN34284_c0_g1_i1.p1 TRINITY_DN34284_c0_g1~~TRINITY_DN34284_c0_g1_i1.p1  ORF type:complete len:532 (+),score=84.21 TRINITY_DN34284_c0_g1_i1:115-1710(+)